MSNLNPEFEMSEWTHFAQITLLGQKEYERMRDEAEVRRLLGREG